MARPVTLRLSSTQCEWLYYELLGIIQDYTERGLMEPEEEAASRKIVNDLEVGLKLARSKAELDLERR
jgi:hypothetical protein